MGDDTFVYSIYPANVDGDSAIEILTAGVYDGNLGHAQLRVWNYTGG